MEARNARYYETLAEAVQEPDAQAKLRECSKEEREHYSTLEEMWLDRFPDEPLPPDEPLDATEIPELIEFDVGPEGVGKEEVMQAAQQAEMTASFFYEKAAEQVEDEAVRALLTELAAKERAHLEQLDPNG